MAYDFKSLHSKVGDAKEWLSKEYTAVRTGRATPALLDGVQVEAYGSKGPLNHVAGVAIEDARSLRITPYDMEQVKNIEKAIVDADLGVSVGSDDRGVRVTFPELTAERRTMLQKVVKDKLEDARITIRHARDETWEDIQQQEKSKEISEDEKFRYKDDMQKITDEGIKELEEIASRKEKEISA